LLVYKKTELFEKIAPFSYQI